jgi:hypothetical protein
MLAGCPVDRNVFYCLFQYQPELLMLFILVLVCIASLWKFLGGTKYC